MGTHDPYPLIPDPTYADIHGAGPLFVDGGSPLDLADGCGTIDGKTDSNYVSSSDLHRDAILDAITSKVLGLSDASVNAAREAFDREHKWIRPAYTADITHNGVIIFNQTQITQKRFHSVRAVVIHAFIHAGGVSGKGDGDWGDLSYFEGYTFIQAACGGHPEFFKTKTR